jgi:imidazolonepropionase-like amidohydrolase
MSVIAADRPTFVVHLRPEKGVVDPIRALRATLKNALRSHGLRCTTLRSATPAAADDVPEGAE